MNQKKSGSSVKTVSIISLQLLLLLQGCYTPVPVRKSTGPGVHAGIIVLTTEQANELGIRVQGRKTLGGKESYENRAPGAKNQQRGGGAAPALTKAPVIKAYRIARYKDPTDPSLMHEAHTVYRIEEEGDWILNETEQDAQAR